MSSAVGEVLPFAVGVAISPIPIVAVTLMLATPHARPNAGAFLVGWLVGLAAGVTAVYAITGGDGGEAPEWLRVSQVVAGVLALLLAAAAWSQRTRPRTGEPWWLRSLDALGPPRAAGLAVTLSVGNPKNLVLIVGAATALAEAEAGDATTGLAAFVVLGCLGVAVPLTAYLLFGERSRRSLERLRAWFTAHDAVVLAVILLVVGAKLIADGL